MKKVIILFILILIPFKLCLASYEEQFFHNYHSPSKRLRYEVEDLSYLPPAQWNNLSYEGVVNIFDYLSFKELKIAQLVCKQWATVARDETLSIKYHFLKSSHACLLRKIDQNQKIKEYVKKIISKYVIKRNIIKQFYMIPDFLHKSLLAPLAIRDVMDAPELLPPLFESNIKASHIHAALNQTALYDQQQWTIESYIKSKPVFMWEGSIFSEEFVNYASLYRPYYKALYLLALFKLPSGSPIYRLLDIIRQKLSNAQAYIAENEQHILCLPQAMLHLEIPPVECYKIGTFCYKWAVNNLNLTFKNLWEGYEERFLSLAALGNLADAHFRLGVINYYKGAYHKAEFFLRQAASQAHTKAQYELGLLLLEQSKVLEAEIFLYHAAMKGHLLSHFALAQLWFQQSKFDEAKSAFRQVAEQASGKVLYQLAQLLEGNFHRPSLELFYRQIVSYAPFDQQQVLMTLLLSKNDLRQIDPFYRQVLNYGNTNIQYILADLLNKKGSTTLAKILLEEIDDQKGL